MSIKPYIPKEAIAAYKRAIALRSPLHADPVARQEQQHQFYLASETLRIALDRSRVRVEILDTIGTDVIPRFISRQGPQFVEDYRGAIAIRKELERLCREEMADGE
jgi:hypothetical protein